MAVEPSGFDQEIPFLKHLASGDRQARDKAVSSLRSFLASNRDFTQLELLKLWKGLFFCMWHSDRLQTQQKLAVSLAGLVSPLNDSLFIPFMAAFWTTSVTNFHLIDSYRLDKFLFLIRNYVNAAFWYLEQRLWPGEMLSNYLKIIEDILLESQGKVSDGLKYHLLDIWVDELDKVDERREAPLEEVVKVVNNTKVNGRTKILRSRANDVLADERLNNWVPTKNGE